jgi:hypothetical protein
MCGKYGYLKILNILLADPNLNPTVEVLQSAIALASSKGDDNKILYYQIYIILMILYLYNSNYTIISI